MVDFNDIDVDAAADEALTHYGKLGMKWGKHTAASKSGSSSGSKSSSKPDRDRKGRSATKVPTLKQLHPNAKSGNANTYSTGDQIRRARGNVELQRSQLKTSKAIIKNTTQRGSEARKKANAKLEKMHVSMLNNPDRITAHKKTMGEQFVSAFTDKNAGSNQLVNDLITARIQSKQESGSYNVKNKTHFI